MKDTETIFFDTGLLCHLLGLNDEEKLKSSDKFGIIFENLLLQKR
ncbi:MAG: DUF4143 domain-containing protein [Saprospiraceae bacterium]|nr:DUF4143 domain-containing protein [Saprospiraceae bacterium]